MKQLPGALFAKTDNHYLQLFRYVFVAGAAFAVDFSGLIILKQVFNINYLLTATLSFSLGVVVNFYLSTKWIFFNPRLTKRHHEFVAVLSIATVGLALNDLILWVLTSKVGVFYIYSKLVATAVLFFWNFYIRKWFLYEN